MTFLTRLRYRLAAWFVDRPDALERRVRIETRLLRAGAGKRPLPTADECREWAQELGVPSWAREPRERHRSSDR